jgi:hypothetical protein
MERGKIERLERSIRKIDPTPRPEKEQQKNRLDQSIGRSADTLSGTVRGRGFLLIGVQF